MLKLKRLVKLTEQVELPNGETIDLCLNVEAHMPDLIRAQNAIITATMERAKDPTKKLDYVKAVDGMLRAVFEDNYAAFVAAFDDDVEEAFAAVDNWLALNLLPAMQKASAARMKRHERDMKRDA